MSTFSEAQIAYAVKKRFVSFEDFVGEFKGENADLRFVLGIDRLLINIYLAHLNARYLTKSQACKFIPAEHIDTCKRYINEGERHGFFSFEKDPLDARKTNLVPTPEFIEFIEKKAVQSLLEVKSLLGNHA